MTADPDGAPRAVRTQHKPQRPRTQHKPRTPRARLRRRTAAAVLISGVLAMLAPAAWLQIGAADRIHDEKDAPTAEVVIVLGSPVASDGRPLPFVAGRLDTTIALLSAGKARAVLVSGYSSDGSETTAMARYLRDRGVEPRRMVVDPYGVDTYDTCRRAREVYGVRRALMVTQRFHLSRAVTLCRHLGINATGVIARCDGCDCTAHAVSTAREVPAAVKAALDVLRDRPPAISSPPQPRALRDALSP